MSKSKNLGKLGTRLLRNLRSQDDMLLTGKSSPKFNMTPTKINNSVQARDNLDLNIEAIISNSKSVHTTITKTAGKKEKKKNKTEDTLRLVATSHPVSAKGETYVKDGKLISKPLWHEIKNSFGHFREVIRNYKDKNVTVGSWLYSDCDRHPNQQDGIITLGSITEKLYILQGLGVDLGVIEDDILKCIDEIIDDFDKSEKNHSNYREIVKKHQNSINKINILWEKNKDEIVKIYSGADYRVSSSDLDRSSNGYKIIEQTLQEIRESNAQVKRFIVADCENVLQISEAKRLIAKSGLNLELIPLFEDRVQYDDFKDIMDASSAGKTKMTVMLAGSDSCRRIGRAGVFNLLFNIAQYRANRPDLEFMVFIGCGNTHFRSENLASLIPNDENLKIDAQRTIQGGLFENLADPKIAKNFAKDQKEKMKKRPTFKDMEEVRSLFKKLDADQKQHLNDHGDDPFLIGEDIEFLLNNTKVFGSRHKPNKFNNEFLSQNDLLNGSRAIEHAWIWQTTGVVSFEVKELCHAISSPNLKNEISESATNPYIQDMITNSIKSLYYIDNFLAKNYYKDQETRNEDLVKLNEVKDFINENFMDIKQNRDEIMADEFKYYGKDRDAFKHGRNDFIVYRFKVARAIDEKDPQSLRNVTTQQYNTQNHPSNTKERNLYGTIGRNYSTDAKSTTPDQSVTKPTASELILGVKGLGKG